MTLCITCLKRNANTTISKAMNKIVLLALFLIRALISSRNTGFLFYIRKIRMRLSSSRTSVMTSGLIHVFSNPLHCSQIETQILKTSFWIFRRKCLFNISGEVNCIMLPLFSQTMPSWLEFVVQKTKRKTYVELFIQILHFTSNIYRCKRKTYSN